MPETLLFEVFNEPHVMSVDQLNVMNAAVHPIIRASNPNRIVLLGGVSLALAAPRRARTSLNPRGAASLLAAVQPR